MTHILVATDMSPRGRVAVQRALTLAPVLDGPVTVLTVLDDAMPDALTATLAEQARAALVADVPEGTVIDVRVGDPVQTILAAADGADLLVLGTHRPRSFLGELRETTMQRIARLSTVPVLVAAGPPEAPYRAVLGACDFSPAAEAALALALRLAPKAEVTPIHVVHIPYAGRLAATGPSAAMLEQSFRAEIDRDAARWRGAAPLPARITERLEVVSGAPGPILRDRAGSGAADLIAMGAHGRVGAARSLMGSLATDMMRDPPCDLLIARPH
ncbi:MAG: universal stress protein [Pseudomonadota bacterium]